MPILRPSSYGQHQGVAGGEKPLFLAAVEVGLTVVGKRRAVAADEQGRVVNRIPVPLRVAIEKRDSRLSGDGRSLSGGRPVHRPGHLENGVSDAVAGQEHLRENRQAGPCRGSRQRPAPQELERTRNVSSGAFLLANGKFHFFLLLTASWIFSRSSVNS
jgi:hypothetical protein